MAKVLSRLQMGFQHRNRLIDIDLDVGIACHLDFGLLKGGESFLVIADIRGQEFTVEFGALQVIQPILLDFIGLVRIQGDVLLLGLDSSAD